MKTTAIVLAGQSFEVAPPPFGRLRKIIAAFNSMRSDGGEGEDSMQQAGIIFALLIGKTVEEIDEMPIGVMEMAAALTLVPEICGLVEGKSSGEAPVVTDSIESTVTS